MNDLAKWITQRRFDEYLVAANHDHGAAVELYQWNAAVSGAFFELIAHVEVTLRNAVDAVLEAVEVPASARVTHRQGWWFTSSTFLTDADLEFASAAKRHLGAKYANTSRDKVLASLTFGMWDAIFQKSYEGLFRKHLVDSFPNRDTGFTRAEVQRRVSALRILRNRIAHHQAIFDLPLEERFEQAMDLLRWIDPGVEAWVLAQCRVPALLDARPPAGEQIVVVVPASRAWNLYLIHHAYICAPARTFRRVSHMAFYHSLAVQLQVPKITARYDELDWSPEEIGRRMATGSTLDLRIAEVIRDSRAQGFTDPTYQLFLLSGPDKEGAALGHITLDKEIRSPRRGRGSAWAKRPRYVAMSTLAVADTVADLETQ